MLTHSLRKCVVGVMSNIKNADEANQPAVIYQLVVRSWCWSVWEHHFFFRRCGIGGGGLLCVECVKTIFVQVAKHESERDL